MNCNDSSHCKDLCTVYHSMAGAVYKDSRPCSHKRQRIKPGWNKYVGAYHDEAENADLSQTTKSLPTQGMNMQFVISANMSKK